MISTVFIKKAKIPVTVDIQRVTGILYVLKCQRWAYKIHQMTHAVNSASAPLSGLKSRNPLSHMRCFRFHFFLLFLHYASD